MSVESDCQKDCEQTFAHDAKSRHKCVRGCHGELVGKGLWDKDNPTYQVRVFNERRDVGELSALGVPAKWVWGRDRNTGAVRVSPSSVEAEQIGVPEYVVAELAQRLDSLPVNTWVQVGPHGEGARSAPRPLTRQEVRDLEDDERAMRRYARGLQREEAEWRRTQKRNNPSTCTPCGVAENPIASGWLWLGAAAAVGVVAWLATRKKSEGVAWTCKVGHECTKRAGIDLHKEPWWTDEDLVTKELKKYDDAPSNLSELTLDRTGPLNDYWVYVVDKPAVLNGPPDVYGSFG